MKAKNQARTDKVKLAFILILSILVIVTSVLYAFTAYKKGDIWGAIPGILIALVILTIAFFVFIRGTNDMKEGFPLHDERSKRVLEKASSLSFYISLYVLLGVGWLSDDIIKFRDASQATGVSVGIMALIFCVSWIYYNKKEI